MPTHLPPEMLRQALIDADEQGYRLEIIDGLGVWEVMPARRHIKAATRIKWSVRPKPGDDSDCGCVAYADLYVRFPDGSLRRTDIAVFSREPDEEDEAVTLIPEAVIEIVSAGSERKDLELSPPFYLRHGIRDVIVYDPYTDIVWYRSPTEVKRFQSPIDIELKCGCIVTV